MSEEMEYVLIVQTHIPPYSEAGWEVWEKDYYEVLWFISITTA